MASDERTEEILEGLHQAVVKFDEDEARHWASITLDEGVDPFIAIMDGLADGMIEVGDLYNRKEYFVPELLMCGDALYAGLDILKPAAETSGREAKTKGTIILGVVEGDVHDIGKNLVKMMFDVAGWTVHDLGKDVPINKFVEEQVRVDSDIVGISAMMTTSMLAMPEIIKKLREKNPNIRILLGGAPINPDIAEKYGADGYAKGASTAVDEAMRLIKMLRQEELGR